MDVKADISARQLSIQLVPWPSVLAVLAVDASSRWGKKRRPFVSVLLRRSVVGLQQLLQEEVCDARCLVITGGAKVTSK